MSIIDLVCFVYLCCILEQSNFDLQLIKMSSQVTRRVYNTVLRRTSTFAVVVIAGAFIFERSIDMFTDYMWKSFNKGVSPYLQTCNGFSRCQTPEDGAVQTIFTLNRDMLVGLKLLKK